MRAVSISSWTQPAKDSLLFLGTNSGATFASLFPPERCKSEVREVARNRISRRPKRRSQEICFVPDGNYAGFIDRYLEAEGVRDRLPPSGEIVDNRGAVVGEHSGIHRYTVGQRRGIGIPSERPLYVLGIDAAKNRVMVGEQDELLSSDFIAAGVNWIAYDNPANPIQAKVRIRYRHNEAPATITPLEDNRVKISFDVPQRAITPGRRVFYDGDEVMVAVGW